MMKLFISLQTPIRPATVGCQNILLLLVIHSVYCITMYHSWRWLILVRLLLSSSATARGSFSRGQYFEYDEELAKLSLVRKYFQTTICTKATCLLQFRTRDRLTSRHIEVYKAAVFPTVFVKASTIVAYACNVLMSHARSRGIISLCWKCVSRLPSTSLSSPQSLLPKDSVTVMVSLRLHRVVARLSNPPATSREVLR